MSRFRLVSVSLLMQTASLFGGTAHAYDLEVSVDSLVVQGPASGGILSVWVINRVDDIAGFELFLELSRPNLIQFVPANDDNLVFDRTGTLIENWQVVIAAKLTSEPDNANIVGLADIPQPPFVPPVAPSPNRRELIRLPFVFLPGADSVADPTVEIKIASTINLFGFATSAGNLIGESGGTFDTSIVKIIPGQVRYLQCCHGYRGNVNCDPGNIVDISDLVLLVDYLFIGFPFICCPAESNADGSVDERIDIADLTFLVDHLFISNPPLPSCQ